MTRHIKVSTTGVARKVKPPASAAGASALPAHTDHSYLKADGLTGATAASRYVGATASGAPASGTFAVGDYVVARDGAIFVCITAGTPGTWASVAGSGSLPTGTTKGDLAVYNGSSWVRLGAGANDTVLTAASAEATGLKWATGGSSSRIGAAATRTSTQSISNITATNIIWQSELSDPSGFIDVAGANPERFTVPTGQGGLYRVNMGAYWAANTTGTRISYVFLNNTTVLARMELNASAGAGSSRPQTYAGWVGNLSAGDYVTQLVFQQSGGALNVEPTNTWMMIEKLVFS